MQKDYRPIEKNLIDDSEIKRIDAYWSSVWADREFTPSQIFRQIENCDEYKVIDKYLQKLPNTASILDGGCGMGEWSVYLKSRGYKITGLDISSSTIERLKSVFLEHDWQVGDINNLEFGDKTFDAYLSWGTFEHFEAGLLAPIKEAWRVLKPGGYLFISVPQDSLRLMHERYGRWQPNIAKSRLKQAFYQWRLTKREIAFEVEQEDFEIKSIVPIHKQEGVGRLFRLITNCEPSGLIKGRLVNILAKILPGIFAGHMLILVAQKKT